MIPRAKAALLFLEIRQGMDVISPERLCYSTSNDLIVLFEGTKLFVRTKDFVEVVVVLHSVSYTIEIVAFHVKHCIEVDRLYLNLGNVEKVLDQHELSTKLKEAKLTEAMTDFEENRNIIVAKACASFILDRLSISTTSMPRYESKHLIDCVEDKAQVRLFLQSMYSDEKMRDLICPAPPSLNPITVYHNSKRYWKSTCFNDG